MFKDMDNISKILICFIVDCLTRTSEPLVQNQPDLVQSILEEKRYQLSNTWILWKNCSIPCPKNCREGHCDAIEGSCLSCSPGYSGPWCEEACKDHTYGLGCLRFCGNCKNGEACDHLNGSCPSGCMPGYSGATCETGCIVGIYGTTCPGICSENCKGHLCSHITGHCEQGCQIGWRGPTCDTKCDGGRYGENCTHTCGFCDGNEQCHHMDGTCRNGCESGYWGDRCTRSIAKDYSSVRKSACHDSGPRSIVLYSFAALFFTSFVFNIIMVFKLRLSWISESRHLIEDNEVRSTTIQPDRVYVTCPGENFSQNKKNVVKI